MKRRTGNRPEIWGGIECTVNRVGQDYFDQIRLSGHQERISDLDRIASLGVRRLRYPVIWERNEIQPGEYDWSWSDERLARIKELGMDVIAGLVHHGSGPTHTSLLDPCFGEKLAVYARAVAQRYPWIDAYTPVNEPLTTARFSGLYGLWYPHAESNQAFAQCLLNEVRGTVLAMRAIREINPDAKLVQTDDLGKTYSTPLLSYQADFENERRWVTWDLLCGTLTAEKDMYKFFVQYCGVAEDELQWFIENPCPPDILGVNYYATSERFLDHRLEHFPVEKWGGNGRHEYVDVEAVRVQDSPFARSKGVLQEAWDRYGIPIAVTEAHLGCTREEQLRWLNEIYVSACELAKEGVDMKAVTVWSLFGAVDWSCLLTRMNGCYEPGVFDLRADEPRETALAPLIRDLADSGRAKDQLLRIPGWWARPQRFEYPPDYHYSFMRDPSSDKAPPVLITGGTGTLGRAFARLCDLRGIPYVLSTREYMDITSEESIALALEEVQPWAVINTAGFVRVDDAATELERCIRDNTLGPILLSRACAARGLEFVTFSSDLVFDGMKPSAYTESDLTSPLNIYGASKVDAESGVLDSHPGALVIRTSAFFGPWDDYNFVTGALRAIEQGQQFMAADDLVISPTYVPHMVNATLDVLLDEEVGIWHLANRGEVTWAELARMAARMAGLPAELVQAVPAAELNFRARRPRRVALASERGWIMPSLEEGLAAYFKQVSTGTKVSDLFREEPSRVFLT